MNRRRRREKRMHLLLRMSHLNSELTPFRMALAGLIVLLGGWLIVTRSLPYALADNGTETALWLSPNHPAPLMSRVQGLRAQLLRPIEQPKTGTGKPSKSEPVGHDATAISDKAIERETLRASIIDMAHRVLEVEPLNAQAYRILGEASQNTADVRGLMQAATLRFRRESVAVYWLLNDSTNRGEIEQALDYADVLLRSRRQLTPYVVAYLAHIAEASPDGLKQLVDRLIMKPPWRVTVLRELPRVVRKYRTPLNVMLALNERASPVAIENYIPYLEFLITNKKFRLAYGAWLQFQNSEGLALVGLINNGGFDNAMNLGPFGWQLGRGQNVLATFQPHPKYPKGISFRLYFGEGRVRLPKLRQTLLLGPGQYTIAGEVIGLIEAKRGLEWVVRCAEAQKLNSSGFINGSGPKWSEFSFTFTVPDAANCRGQIVELRHSARSASEQFIAGEIWFDSLRINRFRPGSETVIAR